MTKGMFPKLFSFCAQTPAFTSTVDSRSNGANRRKKRIAEICLIRREIDRCQILHFSISHKFIEIEVKKNIPEFLFLFPEF